jgi:hypothetical protein
VAKATDELDLSKASDTDLANAVAQLSPEEALFFLAKLEAVMNKRKLQLTGYLLSLAVWLVAMVGAMIYFGSQEGFTGWVFLVPFALVGVILWAFGRWATKVGNRVEPLLERERAKLAAAKASKQPAGPKN